MILLTLSFWRSMPQVERLRVDDSWYQLDILPCLPRCCTFEVEHIADKKVQGIALNCIERLVDWLASWFDSYRSIIQQKQQRVHSFSMTTSYRDGAIERAHPILFDCTRNRIAHRDVIPWGHEVWHYITLNRYKVFFNFSYYARSFTNDTTYDVFVGDWVNISCQIDIRLPLQNGEEQPRVEQYVVNLASDLQRNVMLPDYSIPEHVYHARPMPVQGPMA